MKINIKEIAIKNFLSVGNKWITIDFREGLYRVFGENLDNNTKNGVGKSAVFIDSLMFALFGKPVRDINKPDIPNTINNKKGCEVKLTFDVEDKSFMIHRGISRSFLKLYEDYKPGDENVENGKEEKDKEESAVKYTQQRIDNIIKAGFNTFSHMLIMSSSYTSPFLELKKQEKREIIESILGVTIFGDMNKLAKDHSLELKSELKVYDKEYELKKSSLVTMEENHGKLKEKAKEFNANKKKKIEYIKEKLRKINSQIDEYKDSMTDEDEIEEKIDKLEAIKTKYEKKLNIISSSFRYSETTQKNHVKTLDKLKGEPSCPICGTETSSDHVAKHITELEGSITNEENTRVDLKEKKQDINDKLDKIDVKIKELAKEMKINQKVIREHEAYVSEKKLLAEQVMDVKKEKNNFLDLINEDELNDAKANLSKLEVELEDVAEDRKYYEYIRKLLSEDGVKNYIIKKILKFWNTKVNFYLNEMNAEFSIKFDDQLNAIIKSRNRDPLTYHSFSGGEKARIDVAILLSIIDISKIQNSIDLNVMVIDELLDGGLDDNGREDVLNLFKRMVDKQGKSIYVISHNNNLPNELFNKDITLYKKNGFTTI
jgi:DNA repair exonuclease SbcCD ATPase subunit